jgi:hypothetical protein
MGNAPIANWMICIAEQEQHRRYLPHVHLSISILSVVLHCCDVLWPSCTPQAQVDFLRQLQPQLGPVLQGEVAKAEAILRDVLAQQQQLAKQEQQGKQGGKVIT